MARNEEKAMAMFNQWQEAKQLELGLIRPKGEKRPGWISQINDLGECERWRNDVIREINQKTAQIQNTSLGEYRLREINDEINKLLRTKRAWEHRIRQLGGPDYIRASRVYDKQGRVVPASSYKYFGAAKELPGVKEQLQQDDTRAVQKTRVKMDNLRERLDADYFGFYDDEENHDNFKLERLEAEAEKKLLEAYLKESATHHGSVLKDENSLYSHHHPSTVVSFGTTDDRSDEESEGNEPHFAKLMSQHGHSTVTIPSQKEVEAYLVEQRKQELLGRYG